MTHATLKEWAMTQGLNSNIEAMSQAEKTMLRYQYVLAHTGASQGDFARTAETWANQIRILKENFKQLSVIVGNTFIQALKPLVKAVNQAMASILNFATTVYNALGKIFGWKFEPSGGGGTTMADDMVGAEDASGGIADNLGEASDNAKKLKSHLLAIDELNVYEPSDDSANGSGGSGGGAGGTGDIGQFVKDGNGIFEEFESEIDSLYELGEYIRDALIGAMESIDWDSIYEKARGFGKGLAEFLNGLFATDADGKTLFGELGRTIASTLNAVIYSALEFALEFDWKQFGYNLADGINNFFRTFDFEALSQTLNEWVNGLQETITSFLEELEWDSIVEGIGTFLGSLEGDTILTLLGIANIKKFGNLLGNLIGKNIGTYGNKMSGGVPSDVIEKNAPMGTAEGVSGLTLAFEGLSFAIEACVLAAEGLIILDIIKEPMIDLLGSMTDNKKKAEELKETYKGLAGTIQMVVDSTVPFTSFFNGLPTIMGGASNASLAMSKAFDEIADGTIYTDEQLEKMRKTWSLTKEDVESLRQAMLDANDPLNVLADDFGLLDSSVETLSDIKTGIDLIKDGTVNAKDAFEEFSKPMWGMNEDALTFFQTLETSTGLEKFQTNLENTRLYMENFSNTTQDIGKNISEGVYEGIETASPDEATQGFFDKLVSKIKSIFGIHSPATEMMPLGENIFLGILEGFTSRFEDFTTAITEFYESYILPWFTLEKWYELSQGIVDGIALKWEEFKIWWSETALLLWWTENVEPWFSLERWLALAENIKTSISTKWNETVTQWKTNITTWWNVNVAPWFKLEKWQTMLQTIPTAFKEAFRNGANGAIGFLNKVISGVETLVNSVIDAFNDMVAKISGLASAVGIDISFSAGHISLPRIPTFYDGGFPRPASLFFAGEYGVPEMVGTIGGKTAVASGAEITGIREEISIMRQQMVELQQQNNVLLQIIADKELTIDERTIVDTYDGRKARNGYSFA